MYPHHYLDDVSLIHSKNIYLYNISYYSSVIHTFMNEKLLEDLNALGVNKHLVSSSIFPLLPLLSAIDYYIIIPHSTNILNIFDNKY